MVTGYKVISFEGKNLTTSAGITVAGIYNAIESATKPLLLTDVVIDSVEQKPLFIGPYVDSDDYKIVALGGTITVDADDNVTFAV